MRIPYLPATLSYVLAEHVAAQRKAELEKKAQLLNARDVEPAPVWVYKPLTFEDTQEWGGRVVAAQQNGATFGKVYGEIFSERVVKVHNLTIGDEDEPFDAKNKAHVDAINPVWPVEVGQAIFERARLSEELAGKFSSPSS